MVNHYTSVHFWNDWMKTLHVYFCNLMYSKNRNIQKYPSASNWCTHILQVSVFLAHTHGWRISDDCTLRAPHVSSTPQKKSLKLFIKSFFVPQLKLKKRGVGGGWGRTRGEGEREEGSHLLLYYSSVSSHPLFAMLTEDKIGHPGIGWCSHGDWCLSWHRALALSSFPACLTPLSFCHLPVKHSGFLSTFPCSSAPPPQMQSFPGSAELVCFSQSKREKENLLPTAICRGHTNPIMTLE